jgi:lipoate-protein ligase A
VSLPLRRARTSNFEMLAKSMNLLDLTLPTAVENIALDEALLLQAETGAGDEVLRFWEWTDPVVVLGSGGRWTEDIDEAACLADDVPVLRRASGGGTVLLAQGCLCFSLVLAYDRAAELCGIRPSYQFVLSHVQAALADLVPGATLAGISDLAADGRKFSGNAQQRKRKFLLHHGTLLYGLDLALVARYLRQPVRQPSYRDRRAHQDFLMNLPVGVEALKDRLQAAWQAETTSVAVPTDIVQRLVAEKHGRQEWIRRR